MHQQVPPEEYYKKIAKVPTSGGAVLRNQKGEFLIVRLSYKDGWHISGGVTDIHESPREAVIREVREELGITITEARLFCVDFAKSNPFDRILFVFDCGVLDDEKIKNIKIDNDEIVEFKFVPLNEMLNLLKSGGTKERITNSIHAFTNGSVAYLEDGNLIS